jgi:hypothetical protein
MFGLPSLLTYPSYPRAPTRVRPRGNVAQRSKSGSICPRRSLTSVTAAMIIRQMPQARRYCDVGNNNVCGRVLDRRLAVGIERFIACSYCSYRGIADPDRVRSRR